MAIASRTASGKGKSPVAGSPIKPTAGLSTAAAQVHEATMTVSTTILEGGTIKGEPVENVEREIKVFATNPAHTSVSLGYNKNLGNIEMAKVQVMVSMPHYVEEADTAFQQVLEKAKQNLDAALAELEVVGDVAGAADVSGEPQSEATDAPAEEGEVTPEYLDSADHDTLVAVAEDNPDLGVNPADYVDDDDLREVLKSVIFPDGEATGEGEAAGEESGDDPYTQETLEAATTDELKEVFSVWEMGKWPPGPEKIARKTAIKKILAKQEEAAAG